MRIFGKLSVLLAQTNSFAAYSKKVFLQVRRKIARLRTYLKIQTGMQHYVQSIITPKYSSFRSVNPS